MSALLAQHKLGQTEEELRAVQQRLPLFLQTPDAHCCAQTWAQALAACN